jgi:hypothetical protein
MFESFRGKSPTTSISSTRSKVDDEQERTDYAEELWESYFDSILHACIDYEQSEESALRRVRVAARLADEALKLHQERWVY